jgi:transcriptional regulator with XRE-family HTH domain
MPCHTGKLGAMDEPLDDVLGGVAARLRALRQEQGATLAQLSARTGISVSTLSRLESGGRRPTLELLLPLARAHGVALDELVGTPPTADPRVRRAPVQVDGMTAVPLTRAPGAPRAYKLTFTPQPAGHVPEPRTHEGYEWLFVLSGRLRLVLGEHDLVLGSGEAAEFDCRTPHWSGSADDRPVEVLSLFGPQGERAHVRARPRRPAAG